MRISWFIFWLTIFLFLMATIVYYGFWRSSERDARRFTAEATAAVNKFVEDHYMKCDFPGGATYYVQKTITIDTVTGDTFFLRYQKYVTAVYDQSDTYSTKDTMHRDFSLTLYKPQYYYPPEKRWAKNGVFWKEDSTVFMYTYQAGEILFWHDFNAPVENCISIYKPELSCDDILKKLNNG